MNQPDIFDLFKRNRSIQTAAKKAAEVVLFQLKFDDKGAYISIIDKKGKEVEADYQQFSGVTRSILRSISHIIEKSAFVIDWDNAAKKVYLHEHDYLLEQLKQSSDFVNEAGELMQFATTEGLVQIDISEKNEKQYESRILAFLQGQMLENFVPLNENYVLQGKNIIEVQPLGGNFGHLPHFQTALKKEDIARYLSLLFSYIDNIKVTFGNYKFVETQEVLNTDLALIFEKIDADDSLYMRMAESLPGVNVDFLSQFDIHKAVEINEIEEIVKIKYIQRQDLEGELDFMWKALNRVIPKEKGRKKTAEQTLILQEDLFIIPKEVADIFIYHELPHLLDKYKLFGAEKLKSYKINIHPPRLDMTLASGIDFLEGEVNMYFGDEKISLFEAIQQFQKNRYVQLTDGSHAIMNEAYLKKLLRIFRKKKNGKVEVSFFDLPLVQELLDERTAKTTFAKSKEIFEGFNALAKQKIKLPKVKADLRDYQKKGFQWLEYLAEKQLGGCLADDMGLGKTLQAITLLSKFYPKEKTPTLIVMPKSLLFNWQREIDKFNPNLSYYVYYQQNRDLKEASKCNLIFTTYAMVRNDIAQFKEENFFYVVLDESQNIKNLQSQTNKAITLLKSKHRLALSGTPIENNLSELFALFRFLNPAMFGSEETFNQHYLQPIQKYNDIEATQDLRRKIYPFILRRLKKDVLKELPDKIEQTLYVEMSDEQKRFYEQRRQFYKAAIDAQIASKGIENSQFFVFQALNELRQIASVPESKSDGTIRSPKIETLVEQLSDVIANGHKALVFVNYLAAIELIGEELDAQGIDFVSMTGSTRDRQALVDRFQNDTNCKVFLMTLKTGGTGLNLTAADIVFIFDPWWNKAAENQAIDRTHRMGQTKKVLSYKMITEGTIEEKILLLQEKKSELFNNIISSDAASVKSLSSEDINFILG